MNEYTKMAAACLMAGVPGRGLHRYSILLVVILGTLFFSRAGGSALASSSLSLLSEDINQLAQPAYLAFSDCGSRHLLQVDGNTTNTPSAPLLLARSRTDRPDPLRGLKTYRGGYNLSSVHYGASSDSVPAVDWRTIQDCVNFQFPTGVDYAVVFTGRQSVVGYTGLPAWILALLWAGLGLILLLTLCCMCCCCRHRTRHEYSHGRLGYILPIIALVTFTLAAIAGSILLYYAQRNFNRELTNTLNYVVSQSEITEGSLREVQSNLTTASNINVPGVYTTTDASKAQIASLNIQLNSTANDLQKKTVDNQKKIKDAIDIIRIALIVVAAVMLALVLLGLLFSALGIRSLVYILVLLGWVLVLGTWILCGIFIFLDNGTGDTCLAMQEWLQHPEANTSLDKWLPCNGAAAASAFNSSEAYTGQIVAGINSILNSPINQNPAPSPKGGVWYNQSGPLVPLLCNTSPCTNDTVSLTDASTVWSSYVCTVNGLLCITEGRLTPTFYTLLSNATSDAESFTYSADFLAKAANCTFVRDVFVDIVDNRCHNLRLHSKWIWIGLILVSAGNMLSILLWIVFIRRKRYRFKGNQQQQKAMYKGQSQLYSPRHPPGAVSPAV